MHATNIRTTIRRDGDEYVINGRKWWTSGAMDDRCRVFILMGKTDPSASTHRQQSMILVPRETPGVQIRRDLPIFGFHDQHGHAEITFDDVRVPAGNLLAQEGDGFMIAQARLVLEQTARKFGHQFDLPEHSMGVCAIDQFGDPLPPATLAACRKSDAVLLGAVGGPKWDDPKAKTRPEAGLLRIRKELVGQHPVLVWRACMESSSPFLPFYQFSIGNSFVYYRVDGLFCERLTIAPA